MNEYTPEPVESELPLFAAAQQSTQDKELKRVSGNIAETIQRFFDARDAGDTFQSEELHRYVKDRCQIAPASADRVMRLMRKQGQIAYEVVNRSSSTYRKLSNEKPR